MAKVKQKPVLKKGYLVNIWNKRMEDQIGVGWQEKGLVLPTGSSFRTGPLFDAVAVGKQMAENYVSTWSAKNKPKFTIRTVPSSNKIQLIAEAPNAEGANKSVFDLLDQGTQVRRVILSRDWQSKTAYHQTPSNAGRGKVVRKGTYANGEPIAHAGIEPRDMVNFIQDAVNDALRKNFNL